MGPGMNMFTRWQLGWLTSAQRKMFWPSAVSATQPTQTVTLRSRTESASSAPQVLYVPATSAYMYTVEWSNANNYDQGFGGNNLLVHRINYGDGHTHLVTAAGGVQTAPGSSFTDAAAGVTIALSSVQGSPATATVKVTMGSASPLWSGAPSGSPPADSTAVAWADFDALAGDVVPSNAFIAGFDANAGNLPACRVWFGGGEHLGKVVWNQCSFPWGGAEHFETNTFQVLTARGTTLTWVAGSNGSLPAKALAAGFDGTNTLYVCRAQVAGNWTPGKLIFGACDVSWGGQEIFNNTYQVLTTP